MHNLPLESMTVEEKLLAMESLWDDLCSREGGVPSPAWHGEVLADRAMAIERGVEIPEDWDSAKREIRKKCP